jgi:inorganic triphosphatase YgiF
MSQEVELKLALAAADLPALRCRLGALAPARRKPMSSVYFDDPAGTLAQAHAALRLRRVGPPDSPHWVQTFKSGNVARALAARGEWEFPLSGPALDPQTLATTPLADVLLAAGSDMASLAPCFQTDFLRQAHEFTWRGARIEAALDLGWVQAGARRERIRELELELLEGTPDALTALARRLARPGPDAPAGLRLLPYTDSKAARGLRLAGASLSALPTRAAPAPVSLEDAVEAWIACANACTAGRRGSVLPAAGVQAAAPAAAALEAGEQLLAWRAGLPRDVAAALSRWLADGQTAPQDAAAVALRESAQARLALGLLHRLALRPDGQSGGAGARSRAGAR